MDCPYETEWRRAYTPLTAMEEASRCLLCEDAPCSADCPAGTDPGRFIRSIRFLNDEGAAATILSNNALGDVCARVCPTERYCERRCTRAEVDRPIDIKGLQRFATDFAAALSMEVLEAGPDTGRSVAVVGSGPGALQAAATLRRMGHAVDVYERDTVAGGMLAHGIPAYRLPDDVVAAAVSRIERLGAKVHTGVRVGAGCAVTCQGLLEDHDALLVDVGFSAGKTIPIFDGDPAVELAVDFLARVRAAEGEVTVPDNVLVIGGGDVAMDVSTTLKRLGARTVTDVVWEESDAFLASEEELAGARGAGVTLVDGYAPVAADGGVVTFRHRVIDAELTVRADLVILAVGQRADVCGLDIDLELDGNEVAGGGPATSVPRVFVTGDLMAGDKTVVWAVRKGKMAAAAIDGMFEKGGE